MSVDIKINFFSSEDADSVNIYRATPTIDVNNLPAPIANIVSTSREYQDTGLTKNTQYQYVVGSVYGTNEKISDVIDVNTSEPIIGSYSNLVYKLDQSFNLFYYDNINTLSGTAYAVDMDSNGNLYAVGGTNVVKTDKDNNLVWECVYDSATVYGDTIVKGQDGHVYVGLRDGRVLKISDTDGTIVWTNSDHTQQINQLVVSFGGDVYTASDDNTIKKILPDGTVSWTFNLFTNNVRGICMDENENLYAHGTDNTFRKISPNGTELWSNTGGYLTYYRRMFYRANTGTLYLVSSNNMYSVNKQDGSLTLLFNLNLYNNASSLIDIMVYDNGNILLTTSYSNDGLYIMYDGSGNVLYSGTEFGRIDRIASSPGTQSIQLGLHT